MWDTLPDDVLAIVMAHYRQHLRRDLVHQSLHRMLHYYRISLDSAHPLYTPPCRAIILRNSFFHAFEQDYLNLGPRLRQMKDKEVMPFTIFLR